QRYGLEHPIANDSKFAIWERYGVKSWPTLYLIDPAGKAIVGVSGEGKGDLLDAYISKTIKVFDETKQIDRDKVIGKPDKLAATTVETLAGTAKQLRSDGGPAKTTPLNSPWGVALSADGKLLYIAMAGDHRLWVLDLTAGEAHVLAGNGHEDIVDGSFAQAS